MLKGCAELLVLMDPKVLLVQKATEAGKARLGFKVLLEIKMNEADVLRVLAAHLPIQLAERYGEKTCFVKYHVSEDQSSVVRMTGGVKTLRNVSAYSEPTWHFDAQFVDKQRHAKANVQKAPEHGHVLEMKNTAYHSPYDLVDNKVNAIYIVY